MTAGMNLKGNVWRMYTEGRDDDQGGAVPSGTVIYRDIHSRISALQPTLALLEQGLETPTIFNGKFQYPAFNITGTFEVLPNDVYEVTWPPISVHYGDKFRVISVQYPSFDYFPQKYVVTKLRRLITANSNDLQ